MTKSVPEITLTIPFTREAIRDARWGLDRLLEALDAAPNPDDAPEPEPEPTPKAKAKPKARARKEDTPVDPGTEAGGSVEDMRTQMLMLLAENFGTGRPPKALKDILAEFDATSARDVKDEHIPEVYARIKALVSGVVLDKQTKAKTTEPSEAKEAKPEPEKAGDADAPDLADEIEDLL